jgi:hypothetical protein
LTPLMLLLVDPQVGQNVDVQLALQDCVANLLEADPARHIRTTTVCIKPVHRVHFQAHTNWHSKIEHVGQRIRAHIPNPILIQQLIGALPSYMGASHGFKRRLGLTSFLKSNTYLTDDLDDLATMKLLTTYLHENKTFKIRDNTDFHKLAARFDTLDVALGIGLSKFEFCSEETTTKTDSPVNKDTATLRGPASEEESNLNSAIDEVVAELRSIAFNIRDSGATHMRRTECKTAIEKLSYRFEFAARTRSKPKKGIFGGTEGTSDVIKSFVTRHEQNAIMGNGVAV